MDQLGTEVASLLTYTLKAPGTHTLHPQLELEPGTYYVRLQYAGGNIQQVLEIGETPGAVSKPLDVKVRPNPFHNEFKLYISRPYPELKRAVVRIMDTNGRIIYQKYDAPFNEDITIRPHRGWVNGVYLVHIHASDYSFTYTIVKQ